MIEAPWSSKIYFNGWNNFSRRICAPLNVCRLSVSTADGTKSDWICWHSSAFPCSSILKQMNFSFEYWTNRIQELTYRTNTKQPRLQRIHVLNTSGDIDDRRVETSAEKRKSHWNSNQSDELKWLTRCLFAFFLKFPICNDQMSKNVVCGLMFDQIIFCVRFSRWLAQS